MGRKKMISFLSRVLSVAVMATLLSGLAVAADLGTTYKNSFQHYTGTGKLHPDLKKRFESVDEAEILVVLDSTEANALASRTKGMLGIKSDTDDIIKARAQHHKKKKEALLATIQKTNRKVKEDFGLLPIVHLKADKATLANLLEMPEVAYVGENSAFSNKLAESLPLVNAPQAQNSGFSGSGTAVAVLDGGINYTLPLFGTCTSPGIPAGCKVAYTQDFVSEGSSLSDKSHGTNVSGIIVGVAPDTKILGLNVFRSDGLAYENDVIRALEWVLSNRTAYNIVAVNISFGTGKYSTPCVSSPLASVIGDLSGAGIAVTVASGNDGYKDALSYPACVPGAISVGAVYDASIGSNRFWSEANCTDGMTLSDQVPCFSNSSEFLSLLAPGSEINAADISMSGTSQAAPHVAGAVALLKSKDPLLTVEDMVAMLISSGKNIVDPKNGLSKPRLDVLSALNSVQMAASSEQATLATNGTQAGAADQVSGAVKSTAGQVNSTGGAISNTSVQPQVVGAGWQMGKGKLVTHEQAMARLDERARKSATASGRTTFSAMSTTTYSPEITELALALRKDPLQIFDYVHNNIDYVPYYGSLKGDTLTYLDGSGNDFDQASLLISLFRSSGFTAQYVYGYITLPVSFYASWLGVDANTTVIGQVLGSGGIPGAVDPINNLVRMDHVWVKATVGGVDYYFDPSFKWYSPTSKVDGLPAALGYGQTSFLSGATSGATSGSDYIQNVSEGNIKTSLASYATSLAGTIRSKYPNKTVEEVVGGRSIAQSASIYRTSMLGVYFPGTSSTYATWSGDIPAQYKTTLQVQHAGIDCTLNTADLGGQRLTLSYPGNIPTLLLGGSSITACTKSTGPVTTPNGAYDNILTINHPYTDTYQDNSAVFHLKSGGNYAIAYNFGASSDALIQKRQKQLDDYQSQNLSQNSESILGETLNIIGLTWFKELMLSNKLLSGITETQNLVHHQIGIVAQETGYYIDVKLSGTSVYSNHLNRDDDVTSFFSSSMLIASALEHGVLEQLADSTNPGVSSIKILQIANAAHNKIVRITKDNYATTKSLLTNYGDLTSQLADGTALILPDNGQITLNNWVGKGYLSYYHLGQTWVIGAIINDKYHGGFASWSRRMDQQYFGDNQGSIQANQSNSTTIENTYSTVIPSTSADPVDMAGGAFLVDNTDLALGGTPPLGLSFARSYTSSRNLAKRTMGYGWGHNNDVYLSSVSHAEPVLGKRQPLDAASFIAALYVMADLVKSTDNVTNWVVASFTAKWAVDQLFQNAVTLQSGNKSTEFVKLADGTYASPPGINAKLQLNGGAYSLLERFGKRTDFDSNKKISKITDADGNAMGFSYSGGQLQSVSDQVGRTLTLGYDSTGRVQSVTDSSGRSVSYGYDATTGDLTSYTDPEGKVWKYGYVGHRMTTLTNPLQIITATNTYDTLGRVQTQKAPRQGVAGTTATYNFYFSGFKNVEENPLGRTSTMSGQNTTYFYDAKGREYAQANGLGFGNTKVFDGQDHVVQVTDPLGNLTGDFSYDGNNNLTREGNNHDFGPDQGYANTNSFDPQSFVLTDIADYNGNTTHLEYDGKYHLVSSRDSAGNTVGASYNAVLGLRDTSTDANGVVTSYTYDSYGNPLTKKTGNHPAISYTYDTIGRLTGLTDQAGSLTTFEYDKRGLLLKTTDPSRTNATTFQYNDAGQLTTKTDRNGRIVTYSYTPSGKIDTITYPSGAHVSYTYNLGDQLVSILDSIGTTTYSYDAAGRLSSVNNPYNLTVSYAYDAAGNLTELTYPGGKKVDYTYDAQKRMLSVVPVWLGSSSGQYVYKDWEKGYLPDHGTNLDSSLFEYTYDAAHRLTRLVDNSTIQYNMTLDANGNRTGLERVNEPLSPDLSLTPSRNYVYNGTNNRLLSDGSNTFAYDNEGQLNSGYGAGYTFDDEHRLTGIGGVAQYAYDGAGNRLQAVRSGTVTRYVYDSTGRLLAEADGNNAITRYYLYGASGLLAMALPDGTVYGYQFDPNGNVVVMADQNAYAYDSFGAVAGQQEATAQPFKFAGQYGVMAEPNGLYYMKARFYDPKVGRFISEDPSGFAGGDVNLSAYVKNNPINFIDPSGLCPQSEYSTGFGGSRRLQLANAPYQKVRNTPSTINDVDYSGHALDQMQNRGVTPSVVENTLLVGNSVPGRFQNTTKYFDTDNNVSVIQNDLTGKVITVMPGW